MTATQTTNTMPTNQEEAKGSYSPAALIAIGFFVTTLGQPAQVGGLPLRLLLKDELHVTPSDLASFFAAAALAWYLKPLSGLLCDSVPLLGSRRKSYLLLSTLVSSCLWFCLGQVTHSFMWLLSLVVALNASIVIASTVLGGVLVEVGQHRGLTGQLVSWKFVANNLAGLLVGPMAGYLATRPFVLTTWVGALILLPLILVGFIVLRSENTGDILTRQSHAIKQIKQVVTSRGLILATIFIFLVGIAPGFDTPLLYYQTDTLHFTPQFLGWLALVRGITGLVGAGLYGFMCKRIPLNRLLIIGIILHVLGSLTFLFYLSEPVALQVEAAYGFCYTLAVLPVFDLAARATPKGCEAMGLALIMSLWNVANALSDVLGSWLFDQHHVAFLGLVWLNAFTTLCVLPFLSLVPRRLVTLPHAEAVSVTTDS